MIHASSTFYAGDLVRAVRNTQTFTWRGPHYGDILDAVTDLAIPDITTDEIMIIVRVIRFGGSDWLLLLRTDGTLTASPSNNSGRPDFHRIAERRNP